MAVYQVKPSSSLSFEVSTDEELLGRIWYQSWFKYHAAIEMADGLKYQVVPKGFWKSTLELREGNKVLLVFRMNWKGAIEVQPNTAMAHNYLLKHRGFFKESFLLTNPEGVELITIKSFRKWYKMHGEYEITTAGAFETLPDKALLVMTSILCANYYRMIMAASG